MVGCASHYYGARGLYRAIPPILHFVSTGIYQVIHIIYDLPASKNSLLEKLQIVWRKPFIGHFALGCLAAFAAYFFNIHSPYTLALPGRGGYQ